MRICYFGEFDPFTGSIGGRRADFDRLCDVMARLLLAYDVVLVPPGTLVEHPLGLPLFERFARFARAGRLVTSADHSAPSPIDYFDARVRKADDVSVRKRALHRRDVRELIGRLECVLPDHWPLRRSVGAQVTNVTQQVEAALATADVSSTARRLATKIDGFQQRNGTSPDRNELLAMVASLRQDIAPAELRRLGALVQGFYFQIGAISHTSSQASPDSERICTLYPGRFSEILSLARRGMKEIPRPAYDPAADKRRIDAGLRRCGLDPRFLSERSEEELLRLAGSLEWARVRELLHRNDVPEEMAQAESQPARMAIGCGLRRSYAAHRRTALWSSAPALVPGSWQLATEEAFAPPIDFSGCEVVLDLISFELRGDGSTCRVSSREAQLIALFILGGETGLHGKDLLIFEHDRGTMSDDALAQGALRTSSLRNVVHVTKSRLNAKLGLFGFCVGDRGGRIRLVDVRGGARWVGIAGSLWEFDERAVGQQVTEMPTRCLPAELGVLFKVLVGASPYPVGLRALATAIGKPTDERGLNATSAGLNRLRRALRASRLWLLLRPAKGWYAVAPIRQVL